LNRHLQRVPALIAVGHDGRVNILPPQRRVEGCDLIGNGLHLALKIRKVPRIPNNIGHWAKDDLPLNLNNILVQPVQADSRCSQHIRLHAHSGILFAQLLSTTGSMPRIRHGGRHGEAEVTHSEVGVGGRWNKGATVMKLAASLPREVIETQLSRVTESSQFRNAPRLSRFLTYVVKESLAGRAGHLKGYTIGLEVFDKPDDFDPQTDTIVRVQARSLRQKLDQYYSQEGRDDPVHITIAKGSYEPSFGISWDGEKPADPAENAPATSTAKPSVAVLPFDDFSQNGDMQFFAHGMTEETIVNLSRFRELSVFSRCTTEKLKAEGQSAPAIHHLIGADFILEGSVRIDQAAVDVSINLVDAAQDEIILTDHFRTESTPVEVYKTQDQIALRIAAQITDRIGPLGQYAARAARAGHAQYWDTYHWISRYHHYSIQLEPAARREIREGLRKTLQRDAGSSDAHAALSLVTVDDYTAVPLTEATEPKSGEILDTIPDQALNEARLAVACDPQNALAFEALAVAHFHREEYAAFRRAAGQALRLNPGHGDMLARLGVCYGALADWSKALPLLDRAIDLNPLHPGWYRIIRAIGFAMTKGPAEAIAEINAVPLPDVAFFHAYLIWFLADLGDIEAAQREKELLLRRWPNFEREVVGHLRAWCLDASVIERAQAGWRKVGLNIHD